MSPARALYVYDGKMLDVGIDAVVRRQLAALTALGWGVDLVARGRADVPGVEDHVSRYTVANLISWLPRRYYYPAQKRRISRRASRLLDGREYAAVISWPQRGLHAFRRARALSIPCVLNCDTVHFKMGRRADRTTHWPEFSISEMDEEYRLATRILAPSEFSRQTFLDAGVPPEKLSVIGRGVDTGRYRPAENAEPARPFRLVFCGRVSERKGIRQMIAAWRQAALEDAELWIIGEVADDVADFVRENSGPGISVFGFRHDAEMLLRQCDAQILLSRHEGMAKGLLEGAACGLATLATAHSGFPLREGMNGLAVGRKDIEDIARKLRLLYEDRELCRRMGRCAREQVVAEFSWERFAQRFTDALLQPPTGDTGRDTPPPRAAT